MKKFCKDTLRRLPKLIICTITAALLIMYPKEAADGIRNGLSLLASDVIPAVFPFMVLASYVFASGAAQPLCRILKPLTSKLLRVSSEAALAVIMGLIGGYPVGAKTVAELYEGGVITRNEAERLMFYCINASPAFTVSAVGVMCLGSIKKGFLLYGAVVLSALTAGFFCRFLDDGKRLNAESCFTVRKDAFSHAVATSAEAMLGISGWILVFSALSRLAELAALDENTLTFVRAVCEVTTGCRYACTSVPLQFTGAMLGFGGFAVICQITVYTDRCAVELKRILSARLINASLCAFYTNLLMKIFPEAVSASAQISAGNAGMGISHTAPVAAFLLLMCAALILEVDNRRKVC